MDDDNDFPAYCCDICGRVMCDGSCDDEEEEAPERLYCEFCPSVDGAGCCVCGNLPDKATENARHERGTA